MRAMGAVGQLCREVPKTLPYGPGLSSDRLTASVLVANRLAATLTVSISYLETYVGKHGDGPLELRTSKHTVQNWPWPDFCPVRIMSCRTYSHCFFEWNKGAPMDLP